MPGGEYPQGRGLMVMVGVGVRVGGRMEGWGLATAGPESNHRSRSRKLDLNLTDARADHLSAWFGRVTGHDSLSKPSFKALLRVGEAVVGRGNVG